MTDEQLITIWKTNWSSTATAFCRKYNLAYSTFNHFLIGRNASPVVREALLEWMGLTPPPVMRKLLCPVVVFTDTIVGVLEIADQYETNALCVRVHLDRSGKWDPTGLSWITTYPSKTRSHGAAGVALAMDVSLLNALLPSCVAFIVSSHGNGVPELVARINEMRVCVAANSNICDVLRHFGGELRSPHPPCCK